MKKKNHSNEKLEAITFKTLIVGVDIAKHNQWARFVDCRGIEHNKVLKFENNRNGFNAILTRIYEICKNEDFHKVIVGMEPTGHYWKAFANFLLKQAKITVVLVNPYHTKKAKELDDNSQTKSDKKDALTIARLIKDGRYFETYLPHDVYAELRVLTTTRHSMNKRKKSIINTITAVLDEYFPEFVSVFKHPFKGKASMHLMKVCPIPKFILELGEEGVLDEIKKAVKKTVGRKKAAQLVEAAKTGEILLSGKENCSPHQPDFNGSAPGRGGTGGISPSHAQGTSGSSVAVIYDSGHGHSADTYHYPDHMRDDLFLCEGCRPVDPGVCSDNGGDKMADNKADYKGTQKRDLLLHGNRLRAFH